MFLQYACKSRAYFANRFNKLVTCFNMNTQRLFYLLAITTIFAAACGSNDDKKAPGPAPEEVADADDSTGLELLDTALTRENIDTFATLAFTSHAKKQASGFDWSRFRMEHNYIDDSLHSINYTPDKKFYDAYGRFIKYSPDSTKFVDLDSYSVQIKKDGKGQWQATELELDTEVSLVDLKTGKKTRLLFSGPEGSVEDALWLDKDNIALIGVTEGDSLDKVAAVWKINIPTKSFYIYELNDSAVAKRILHTWRKERMKGLKLN